MLNCTCTLIDEERVSCNGTIYVLPEERLSWEDKTFWVYLAIYITLVLAAGLMSGLTMGLLSLDMMTLKVLKDGGTDSEKKHARKIIPIVERHHLLLVTLLLGNAAAVEAMPIFLDRISDPVIAILVSVTAVLIFGEVIPQAVCTRFGLAIGATLAPLVYLLMGIFFIVSWPLSKLLDCLLGHEHSTFYRRAQLKVLVDLHGSGTTEGNAEQLSLDEVLIIKGALDMKHKTAKDAMVPLPYVYMLDINSQLDNETMSELLEKAHSRVPVYEGARENIVGLLLVKTLIKLDPEDATPVRSLLTAGDVRPVLHTEDDKPLFDLLNEFQDGRGHLAVVHSYQGRRVSMERQTSECLIEHDQTTPLLQGHADEDDTLLDIEPTVVGIITLEDVIEELIQEEIVDETDVYVDIKKQIEVARAMAKRKTTPHKNKSPRLRKSYSHPPVTRLERPAIAAVAASSEALNNSDAEVLVEIAT